MEMTLRQFEAQRRREAMAEYGLTGVEYDACYPVGSRMAEWREAILAAAGAGGILRRPVLDDIHARMPDLLRHLRHDYPVSKPARVAVRLDAQAATFDCLDADGGRLALIHARVADLRYPDWRQIVSTTGGKDAARLVTADFTAGSLVAACDAILANLKANERAIGANHPSAVYRVGPADRYRFYLVIADRAAYNPEFVKRLAVALPKPLPLTWHAWTAEGPARIDGDGVTLIVMPMHFSDKMSANYR